MMCNVFSRKKMEDLLKEKRSAESKRIFTRRQVWQCFCTKIVNKGNKDYIYAVMVKKEKSICSLRGDQGPKLLNTMWRASPSQHHRSNSVRVQMYRIPTLLMEKILALGGSRGKGTAKKNLAYLLQKSADIYAWAMHVGGCMLQ